MIVDNESLNQLVRQGEGLALLTTSPKIDKLVGADMRLLQASDRVPLLDALRAVVWGAERLNGTRVDPDSGDVIAVDKPTLEALLVSLVRVDREQHDMILPRRPLKETAAEDLECTRESYEVARKLSRIAEQNKDMSMEAFEKVISTSPRPEMSRQFLVQAGPDQPELIGPDGPMPKINVKFPETLPAGKWVSLTVKVSHVREREGLARVEIVQFNDEYSKMVLGQQTPGIDLRFNRDSIEFKDLAGAQYLPLKLKILATADCAIHRRYARKAALTLCEVSHPRKTIDELHAMTQKLQCELDFDGGREESSGTEGPREF